MTTLFAQLTDQQEAELRQRLADAPRDRWLGSGQPLARVGARPSTPAPAGTSGGGGARRRPAYNPQTRRHTWERIGDGHSYQCGHCQVGKRRFQEKPGDNRSWITVWVDPVEGTSGSDRGGVHLPDCPGPGRGLAGAVT